MDSPEMDCPELVELPHEFKWAEPADAEPAAEPANFWGCELASGLVFRGVAR